MTTPTPLTAQLAAAVDDARHHARHAAQAAIDAQRARDLADETAQRRAAARAADRAQAAALDAEAALDLAKARAVGLRDLVDAQRDLTTARAAYGNGLATDREVDAATRHVAYLAAAFVRAATVDWATWTNPAADLD
jgi:hypothetical protein